MNYITGISSKSKNISYGLILVPFINFIFTTIFPICKIAYYIVNIQ